ncbi:MAG: cation-transporting P-type ATPase, partial [Oscillospiraceae bacterium]|nr:cation-transporting P-type ATPase [Oscillospiraceae bacterium]
MKHRWFDKSPLEVAEILGTDPNQGLSQREATIRSAEQGKNEIYPVVKTPFRKYLLHILADFMAFLLLLAGAIAAIFGEGAGAFVMLGVIVANYVVVTLSYVKGQRILEDMSHFTLPNAKVMRENRLFMVKQEQLVRGDIIFLSAGDIVPCDARLLEDDGLFVTEQGLTANEKEVQKTAAFVDSRNLPPEARANMLFASTIVTRGRGKAIVCETGRATLVCRMGKNKTLTSHDKLGIVTHIRRYSAALSLSMIGMIFAMVAIGLLRGGHLGIAEVFISAMSLTVSAMPEMMVAFAYIVIACGVFAAVKQYQDVNSGALIKNPSKIGRIRELDCLIIPKEALYSDRDLKVEKVYADADLHSADDVRPTGAYIRVLRWGLISTGLYGAARLIANNQLSQNVYSAEEECLIRAAEEAGIYDRRLDENYGIIDRAPAVGNSRFETTLVFNNGDYIAVCRGAPEQILAHCTCYNTNGRVHALDPAERNALHMRALSLERANFRVIAVATRSVQYTNLKRIGAAQSDLVFEGFIVIAEPLLPEAAKNVIRCREAGIKLVMLCDDANERNVVLAQSLGIIATEAQCADRRTLSTMHNDLIRTNVPMYNMYQGLSTPQLKFVINSLQQDRGYCVGVLGRGLSHVELLQEADVGFSEMVTISSKAARSGVDMTSRDIPVFVRGNKESSRGGCEALKFVSDVIVSKPELSGNGGFNALITAISASKNIYHNIYRMVRYLAVSQAARFLILLYMTALDQPLLTPAQILFSGMVMDFLAVIVIAFQRPRRDILAVRNRFGTSRDGMLDTFIKNAPVLLFSLLWLGLTIISVASLQTTGVITTYAQANTVTFISFILTQFVVLSETIRDGSMFTKGIRINNIYVLACVVFAGFIAAALNLPYFGALFAIAAL